MISITPTGRHSRHASEEDIRRAQAAAEAVLRAAGTTPAAAYAEYRAQMSALDDAGLLIGLAAIWLYARTAADIALTETWSPKTWADIGAEVLCDMSA